ncbi:MAG: AbgT family transporter, partial [Phycisphaerales bacterium]|nr:AbgT family transporter [Phycisphaerales bacterium]
MPTTDQPAPNNTPRKGSFIARFLTFVEWLGNLLPHPVTLFALFALAIIIISAITTMLGVSVEDPRPGAEGAMITTNSLLAPD